MDWKSKTEVTFETIRPGACNRQMFSSFTVEIWSGFKFCADVDGELSKCGTAFQKRIQILLHVENLESPKNKLF